MADDDEKALFNEDLYDLLEIPTTATEDEISKSYRVLARKYHPDRNKGNPSAGEMFKKVKSAMQILTNEAKKKEYDNKRLARLLKRKREEELSAGDRKMKEVLIAKENRFKQETQEKEALKRQTELDLMRLREEGLKKMREQQEKEAVKISRVQSDQDSLESTIQVKWSSKKRIFNEDQLRDIFSAFGRINLIGFPKQKRTNALIAFAEVSSAIAAVNEMGDKNVYHMKVKRAKKTTDPIETQKQTNFQPATAFPFMASADSKPKPSVSVKDHMDFEKIILEKMRQAAQTQQKQKEEQENKTKFETDKNNHGVQETNGHSTPSLFGEGSENENSSKVVDLNSESLEEMKARQAKEREELRRKLLEEDD